MVIQKEEIIDLENQLIEGIKTSDLIFLDKVLHDDLLFIAPNGKTITKEMDLASHKAGEILVEQIILSIEHITIIDDTAIVIVVYDTKGKMVGNPIQGKFRYIRIWKLIGDSLKVIGGSCIHL